ncbi:hypothetical protein RIF23_18895 [Lipingzhangella sp. LS1_29]|uniref:DUF2269 domain-containing protein n=1 Tax=Lipingzhangella rawalii TaxID=2055835 RepID=A0ABU2HCR9_9ACTN|nr:hypothetical protein [Lipingzhangella rawalii]MDS1272359.1 hypothetical protein [Lipingzhangella rawalii]
MIMPRRLRRAVLTAHILSSVGWAGAVATVLTLAVIGLAGSDAQVARAAYIAMAPITRYILVPLAVAALLTGIVQALGTPWGLFRHYWIVAKLGLTVLATGVLLMYTPTVDHLAGLAATTGAGAEIRALAGSAVLHTAGGLLVLLLNTLLAVYKPRGRLPRGGRTAAVP